MRKELLAEPLDDAPAGLNFVTPFRNTAAKRYRQAVKLQLEGNGGEAHRQYYQPGVRSSLWKKLKRPGAVPLVRFHRG